MKMIMCLMLTCSSSIILTERSFSSCCLSSIISLRKSSVFSSSRMSGEPIPSSLSSARLLFGEEPLNSFGRAEKEYLDLVNYLCKVDIHRDVAKRQKQA